MSLTVALRGDAALSELAAPTPADVALADSEAVADLLVAVGEPAVCSLAVDAPPTPVLPVDAGVGRHGLPAGHVTELLRTLAGDPSTIAELAVPHPLVAVSVGEFRTRAILDVALVTSEPARISEYAVTDSVGRLASYRADGVVVATPAGSPGYSRAAGGPILTTGVGLTLVPISPYTTQPDTWVVDPPVTLGVERDESSVSLVVDGQRRRSIDVDDAVDLAVAGTIDLIRPVAPPDGERRLEKL